ncbi:MAG TPA: hypothetical protein VGP07_19625 [Polyangia bacterium]|jgi:hypothetical protein
MKPAHTYAVQTRIDDSSGPSGRLEIFAQEYAPDGSRTRVPFAGDGEINACKTWAQSQGL